ncbi:MAG: phage tail tape measure protein, partial [Bacteroidales bacterium]
SKGLSALKNLGTGADRLQRQFSSLQGCLWKFNQTSELFQRMGSAVDQISTPFREFEQGMADLSALTGIAGKDLQDLGRYSREVGVQSGLGATGAVEAFKLLASQIQVDKIGIEGLKNLQKETIMLAQASGMSMSEAANAMAGTINQFGLEATEANRVINVLAAGSKYGAAEIPDLAQSFKVVGAAANAAGLTIEQTAGAIEVLSKNNLKGSEAGTALRNIMLKMQTELGVDFTKTSLSTALQALTPRYKDASYMAKLFGMENMAAAQFLIANAAEVDNMTKLVTDTKVASEQAAISTNTWSFKLKQQQARFNEWSMSITENSKGIMGFVQMGSNAISMFTPLFAGLFAVGKGALSTFSTGISATVKFAKSFSVLNAALNTGKLQTYSALVARFGVIGRVAAAAIWIKNGALSVGSFILAMFSANTRAAAIATLRYSLATRASAAWTAICTSTRAIAAAMLSLWNKRTIVATALQNGLTLAVSAAKFVLAGGFIPAMVGAISATWAWTAALLANPITWVVLGIGALVAAVVVCWEKLAGFRAVMLTIWDAVKGFGTAILQYCVAPFKMLFDLVGGLSGAIGKLFSGDFKGAWKDVKDTGKNLANDFLAPLKTIGKTVTNIPVNYSAHYTQETEKQKTKDKKVAKTPIFQSPFMAPQPISVPPVPPVLPIQSIPEMQSVKTVETSTTKNIITQLGTTAKTKQAGTSQQPIPATSPAAPTVYPLISAPQITTIPQPKILMSSKDAASNTVVQPNFTIPDTNALPDIPAMQTGTPINVTVNFNPIMNVSGDVTQKGKEDIIKIFRDNAAIIANIIKEELRKTERGNYGLSTTW